MILKIYTGEHIFWNLVAKSLLFIYSMYDLQILRGNMKHIIFIYVILGFYYIYGQQGSGVNLIPIPQKITYLEKDFILDTAFTIAVEGCATERLCA